MARVTLSKVQKVYPGGVLAVREADLEVADKEFVVLVGPSGCGKSTTLRMIAGLEEISAGKIHIDDVLVNDVHPKDRDIAMVFQNYALYPHKNVYKNMSFGLEMRRYPKDEIDKRVREAAEILDITDLLERRPKALSGGQRQRVAVGRAIVRKPKVFLFDEPLSNLDAKLRVQMRAEISRLHHRLEATMIYVTHDQVEAMTMGDRIVVMLDGVIQQVAPPLEIYRNPANAFVATFIGSPPMNLFSGRILAREGGLCFQFEGKESELRVPDEHKARIEAHTDGAITLGVRPEDLIPVSGADAVSDCTVEAMVDVVEPMGSETYTYATTAGQPLCIRSQGHEPPDVGSTILLNVDKQKLYFFDARDGQALR